MVYDLQATFTALSGIVEVSSEEPRAENDASGSVEFFITMKLRIIEEFKL